MRMKEVIRRHVPVADVNEKLSSVVSKLKRTKAAIIPVESEKKVVGTISQQDVRQLKKEQLPDHSPSLHDKKAGDVMHYEFIACSENSLGLEVARLVAKTSIQRLVVMNEKRQAIGVFSLDPV